MYAEVPRANEVKPSKVSVPADCGALPETNVIQVDFSPEAK